MGSRRAAWIVGLASSLLLVAAGDARAEIRRMEAVGTEPVFADAQRSRAPRDAAIQRALLEAVGRLADEFLLDRPVEPAEAFAPQQPPPDSPPDYAKIFGRNLVQYTAHYRILEDRGAGPPLFAADPDVESEYVVIVEVHLDVERVRQRLEEVGLVAPPAEVLETRRIVLEARGLRIYPAYQALQAVLLEGVGAERVVALEFTRDRVKLGVEYSSGGPSELLDALYRSSPRELEITPEFSDELQLIISVRWSPPRPEDEEGLSSPQDEFDPFGDRENMESAPADEAVAAGEMTGFQRRTSESSRRVDTGSRNRY